MRMKLQILLQEVRPLPYYLISEVFILWKSFEKMSIERQEQTNIKISLLVSYYSSDIDLMAFTLITLIFSGQSVFHYISLNRDRKTETSSIQDTNIYTVSLMV